MITENLPPTVASKFVELTERLEPNRTADLKDKLLPICAKFKIEHALPILTKPLRLNDEPKAAASRTERDDPNLAKLLMETQLAVMAAFTIERCELHCDLVPTPPTEMDEPILQKALREIELPKLAKLRHERAEPSLAYDLKEIELPN